MCIFKRLISPHPHGAAARPDTVRIADGSFVGRALQIDMPSVINSRLQQVAETRATYERRGKLALVYLFGGDLAENNAPAPINQRHVTAAIDRSVPSVKEPVTVLRGALEFVHKPFRIPDEDEDYFWLQSRAVKARHSFFADTAVNLHREELDIANNLFAERNTVTENPVMWLGAIKAPNAHAAHEALEPLEESIPSRLMAFPVGILRR